MNTRGRVLVLGVVTLAVASVFSVSAGAERFESTSYTIDASVSNSFGDAGSSTSYKMVSSGGESIIGSGSSGSYKLGQGYIAQLEKSISLSVQPSGLQIYYPFNDTSQQSSYDSSANSNNAVLVATPTRGSGKISGGVTLNGSSQYVTGPDVDLTSAMTAEIWVNPSSSGQTAKLISKHSSTTDAQLYLDVASNLVTAHVTVGGTEYTAVSSTALPSSAWTHLAVTFDGSNLRLYQDGVIEDTTAVSGSMATNNYLWTFGRDASASSGYFAGSLDEFKLFNRALTDNEISAEFNSQDAGNASGLSLGSITAGTSNVALYDAVVHTDGGGYLLAVSQNQDLTNGGNTIPAVSGSIASPVTWSEGTTKGLGFTLISTNATALPGKWNSGASYAAFPGTSTSFYTRDGIQSGKDYLNMRIRADVDLTQVAGTYSNVITITGTVTP